MRFYICPRLHNIIWTPHVLGPRLAHSSSYWPSTFQEQSDLAHFIVKPSFFRSLLNLISARNVSIADSVDTRFAFGSRVVPTFCTRNDKSRPYWGPCKGLIDTSATPNHICLLSPRILGARIAIIVPSLPPSMHVVACFLIVEIARKAFSNLTHWWPSLTSRHYMPWRVYQGVVESAKKALKTFYESLAFRCTRNTSFF